MSDPSQYALVVGNTTEAAELARLPGLTLVYFTGTDVNTHWSTGVPFNEARANGWLLKNASGDLLVNQSFRDNFVGDVGNRAYQQAWIANVLAFLRKHRGIKGVFIDDVLYDLAALAGQDASQYPNQQDSAQAELSFVKAVGPALRSHGYYVLVNASGYIPAPRQREPRRNRLVARARPVRQRAHGRVLPAGFRWQQRPPLDRRRLEPGVVRLAASLHVAQSMGDDFYGLTYGGPGDTTAMTTARPPSSRLGRPRRRLHLRDLQRRRPREPSLDDKYRPAAAPQRAGRRRLAAAVHRGVVLVDPDPSSRRPSSSPAATAPLRARP